jgi:3-hydroxybutyryl-CoA dehydrogenase
MHFFNPVPASSLVEIVTGEDTDTATADKAVSWTRRLGKTEVILRDSPGFATSRLGVLMGLEAIRMVEEGVAEPAAVDRAMELGYRHPMGPLRSTDLVGLDVRLSIAEHLARTLGPRFEPPALLKDKVARGELGRKSGRGFYRWDA